mmetsp:Transcript_15895/g.38063  ORF Transcript_15895/g.38063 Transcript_15895/m.38063 type:complete len:91 (-) Transcript_15895:433-705(-)
MLNGTCEGALHLLLSSTHGLEHALCVTGECVPVGACACALLHAKTRVQGSSQTLRAADHLCDGWVRCSAVFTYERLCISECACQGGCIMR